MSSWLSLSVTNFKYVCIASIFALTIITSILPKKVNANQRVLSIANAFGGGVFLSAGLCHLLFEAHEGMEHFYHFPMAFMMAGIGFILVLCIEEFVHWYSHRGDGDVQVDPNNEGLLNSDATLTIYSEEHEGHGHHHDENHGHSHASGLVQPQGSFISAMVLLIALSFHSFMEGLALGADPHENSSVFIAIIAHKGSESFALGTSLVRSSIVDSFKYYIFLFAFSLMTPLGIAAGMILEKTFESELAYHYIASFAAGTFLYVAIAEIILNEFRRPGDKLFKIISLCTGFGLMAYLATFHEHHHH